MGTFLIFIGLVVMADSHSTMPGIAAGAALVGSGSLIYAFQGDD